MSLGSRKSFRLPFLFYAMAMQTVRLALEAMATRFEVILYGEHPARLRAAGEEALREIRQLEANLSFYRPSSDLSRLNASAAHGPVRVSARLFDLLQDAKCIWESTGGAFDVTVAPLMRCWGFVGGTGHWPARDAIKHARSVTGMHLVTLDDEARTVTFNRNGVQLDLGAIGKGYALEEASHILRECGVERALLHGGTSTIVAIGAPPGEESWKIAIAHPSENAAPLAVVELRDEALSVSAVSGKAFVRRGKTYGHVLDPRTGHPVHGAILAAVAHRSATTCDALSTAFLVLECESGELNMVTGDSIRSLAACRCEDGNLEIHRNGIDLYLPEATSSTLLTPHHHEAR